MPRRSMAAAALAILFVPLAGCGGDIPSRPRDGLGAGPLPFAITIPDSIASSSFTFTVHWDSTCGHAYVPTWSWDLMHRTLFIVSGVHATGEACPDGSAGPGPNPRSYAATVVGAPPRRFEVVFEAFGRSIRTSVQGGVAPRARPGTHVVEVQGWENDLSASGLPIALEDHDAADSTLDVQSTDEAGRAVLTAPQSALSHATVLRLPPELFGIEIRLGPFAAPVGPMRTRVACFKPPPLRTERSSLTVPRASGFIFRSAGD